MFFNSFCHTVPESSPILCLPLTLSQPKLFRLYHGLKAKIRILNTLYFYKRQDREKLLIQVCYIENILIFRDCRRRKQNKKCDADNLSTRMRNGFLAIWLKYLVCVRLFALIMPHTAWGLLRTHKTRTNIITIFPSSYWELLATLSTLLWPFRDTYKLSLVSS